MKHACALVPHTADTLYGCIAPTANIICSIFAVCNISHWHAWWTQAETDCDWCTANLNLQITRNVCVEAGRRQGGLSMNTEFISSWTSFCAVQSSPLLPWLELIGSTGMMTLHSTATQHYYWQQMERMQGEEGKIRTKGWMIRLNFSKDFRYEGMTLNRLDGIVADAKTLGFDTSLVCN